MTQKTIQQGAEAIILLQNNQILKHRIKKGYRLAVIDDKLRKSRTRCEAKLLGKAASLIKVPKVVSTDKKEKIVMEFINGKKLSDWLGKLQGAEKICKEIGRQAAVLHDNDIIHGDLTTSNMIYDEKENNLYFIDFGLGFHSSRIEDKAVDLHLLRQALEAKHFKNWEELFSAVLKGYNSKNKLKVIEQLKKVESRGRYKKGGL